MFKFWYDYVKPKYGEKPKLCYVDTDSFSRYINFIVYISFIVLIFYDKMISQLDPL